MFFMCSQISVGFGSGRKRFGFATSLGVLIFGLKSVTRIRFSDTVELTEELLWFEPNLSPTTLLRGCVEN